MVGANQAHDTQRMSENTDIPKELSKNSLPRVCEKTHLSGAIFVISVETEAGVVTVRAGLDTKEDWVIVGEREGDLTPEILEAVAGHFDANTARRGGVTA